MDRSRRRQVEDLFEAALELPAEARAGYLADQCPDDGELLAEVSALVAAHEKAGGIIDRPIEAAAGALVREATETLAPPPGGERIGPYRVLDELGRGGMGVVYLAERADGHFRRRVAVKVIRSTDPELQARVVAERQILASLDHPNIARLLDGGVTDDGHPWLTMELVGGLPLDVYCDRMRLTVRERLELFTTVAEAVEHAHRNLVIHRDLKPSNILVTADGVVKLLDFGIAKLLNPTLSGVDAPITRSGSQVLTPEYSSPEQLRGETLTTTTDVYSLGILLYRLLTGRLPHETGDGSIPAVLNAVLEGDPDRPSVRVARIAAGKADAGDGEPPTGPPAGVLARDRNTTPQRLIRLLRGDVDAIVMKALRREPSARYGSAAALADDIRRWIEGRPVLAHQGSRMYRLRKLMRRHATEAVAGALVVMALLAGAATAAWQAGVAKQERDRAEAALVQAEMALGESREVTDFLMELFQSGDPSSVEGRDVTARDLIRRGMDRADLLRDQPVVQARLLDVLGQLQRQLGSPGEARALLERAVALRERELGPDHPELASTMLNLARSERDAGRTPEATAHTRRALDIRRRAHGERSPEVAEALYELGWLATGEEQEELYRRARALFREAGDGVREATILEALATNLRRQGRMDEAVSTAREALAVRRASLGHDHPETATAMYHLGDHIRDHTGDHAEAERLFRQGIALQTAAWGEHTLRVVHGLHSLALLLSRRGDHAGAEALYRRALSLREAATGPDNPILAGSMEPLALELAAQGRLTEAEEMARRALAHRERTQGPGTVETHASLVALGRVLAAGGRLDEAEEAFQRAFALRRRAGGSADIVLGEHQRLWGRILVSHGRFAEAEGPLLRAREILGRSYPEDHPNLVDAERALFELYTAWGRTEEAEAHRVPDGAFYPY